MIIYNVTTKVNNQINDDWLDWLKKEHIPDIINTGCFTHAVILHLLDTEEEDESATYAVQYHAIDRSRYDAFINTYALGMRKKALDKWGDQFIAFRSIMEVVN